MAPLSHHFTEATCVLWRDHKRVRPWVCVHCSTKTLVWRFCCRWELVFVPRAAWHSKNTLWYLHVTQPEDCETHTLPPWPRGHPQWRVSLPPDGQNPVCLTGWSAIDGYSLSRSSKACHPSRPFPSWTHLYQLLKHDSLSCFCLSPSPLTLVCQVFCQPWVFYKLTGAWHKTVATFFTQSSLRLLQSRISAAVCAVNTIYLHRWWLYYHSEQSI